MPLPLKVKKKLALNQTDRQTGVVDESSLTPLPHSVKLGVKPDRQTDRQTGVVDESSLTPVPHYVKPGVKPDRQRDVVYDNQTQAKLMDRYLKQKRTDEVRESGKVQ